MRGSAVAVLILACGAQTQGYTYWNYPRHSALLPGQSVTIRTENPSGSGIQNDLLYEGSGISAIPMTPVLDGPSTITATVPGPVSTTRRYGFRILSGADIALFPVSLAPGTDPSPGGLSPLSTDPTGDELFGYANLDLVEYRVSFSDTRLYASLKNAGGGFPTSQGLNFFGYLFAVADPSLAAPDTVFALLFTVNQPGIITPGLYRITGTGFGDLEKIGEIDYEVFASANSIVLSCLISDLLEDPYFSEWFDPTDPALGVAAFTQRITLTGGAQEADDAPGGDCWLRELAISPGANHLPSLSGFSLDGSGATATASIVYTDQDGHCPVLSEIVFDGADAWSLYPLTLDYSVPVTYRTGEGIEPLATGDWQEAVLRFSDNQTDIVEYEVQNTGIGEAATDLTVTIAPNPFCGSLYIDILMPGPGEVSAEVYDLRGALVEMVYQGPLTGGMTTLVWQGIDFSGRIAMPGAYIIRVAFPGGTETRRVVLLR
jgi:hypothetical protein